MYNRYNTAFPDKDTIFVFMHFFQLFSYAFDFVLSTKKQQRFIKNYLSPLAEKLCKPLGYKFNELEKHKVFYYYPLFNYLVNNQNYLILRNRSIQDSENKRLILVSVMATLYDDLIDEEKWNAERLYQLVKRDLPKELQNKKSKLIEVLDDELNETVQPAAFYATALPLAIHGQVNSAQQLQTDISFSEILDRSKEKCGNSSLLWASLLDEDWSPAEKEIIYLTGFINQIVNDIFDIRKDIEHGVNSIMRKAPSVQTIKSLLIDQFFLAHHLVAQLPIQQNPKTRIIERLSCIYAYGLVGLAHLQKTEEKYGAPQNWRTEEIPRAMLVTDMAKLKSWWPYCKSILLLANLKTNLKSKDLKQLY